MEASSVCVVGRKDIARRGKEEAESYTKEFMNTMKTKIAPSINMKMCSASPEEMLMSALDFERRKRTFAFVRRFLFKKRSRKLTQRKKVASTLSFF